MKVDRGHIIEDILDPNKAQYSIPVYQRNYDWSKAQCEKLFQDIIQSSETGKKHFMGSIVNAESGTINKIKRYIIIDGQQRITTIFVLLKALLDLSEREVDKGVISDWLFNFSKNDEIEIDDTNKLKLKPIKTDNAELMLLMSNKYEEMDKSSNIYCNYELFKSLIAKAIATDKEIKDILDGIELLQCAIITLQDDDNPQEVFESINSTGLPLTIADLIRNYVLMTDINQEYLYENYWVKIERLLDKRQIPSFVIDYLNFKMDGFCRESDAYDSFKKLYVEKNYTNESMLEELAKYAEYYHGFIYGSSKYTDSINRYLSDLKKLNQTTIYVFLFAVFDDYESGICSSEELEKLLRFFVSYSVRRIICEVGSNSLRGLYKTLYSRVFNNEENKNHYYDSIVSFLKQIASKDIVPDDKTFTLSLIQNDLYHKHAICKYLLAAIENDGTKEKIEVDNLTIEHVMPQNKNTSEEWKEMLGERWADIKIKYLHTLGNLTLTGYNSELSDNDFDTKKKLLLENSTKVVILNSDVLNQAKWDENAILNHANRLANIAVDLYKIEEPNIFVTFKDEDFEEYTLEDPSNAKFKVPNYFVLCGERVLVSNFADMLFGVIEVLYDLDPTILQRIAKNEEKIVTWSSYAWVKYSLENADGFTEYKDTGIFYNTNLSAEGKIYFIKALLEAYGIDEEDFIYSAKINRI